MTLQIKNCGAVGKICAVPQFSSSAFCTLGVCGANCNTGYVSSNTHTLVVSSTTDS